MVDLPAASASPRASLRALQLWSRNAPTETRVKVRGLGDLHVALERVEDAGAATPPDDPIFAVERGGRWGRLVVDGWLALRLVSSTLGRAPDPSLRQLGRAERGVLAAMLATVFRALAADLRVSLAAAPRAPVDGVTVILKVDVMGSQGRVRLDAPLLWVDEQAAAPFDGSALPVSGTLELGSTSLPAGQLASVRPGDAVVFDGFAPPPRRRSWATRLRVGLYLAEAQLEADGQLRLVDGFRLAAPLPQEPAMQSTTPPDMPPVADVTKVLAAAPVEVVAEIGRVTLRGDEVLGLTRGHVLTLGGARTTHVSLRVGDAIWARGELVDVDGELGVRVVELLTR